MPNVGWTKDWWLKKPIEEWNIADIAEFSRVVSETNKNEELTNKVTNKLRNYIERRA